MKILYFFYIRTDAGYAVKLVIISAFFESFIFCSALETFFSSGTKMQCLQITSPIFFCVPYSEICVPEERNSNFWLNFILGTKLNCVKCNIFTLSDESKQGYSYNVFAGLFQSKETHIRRYFSLVEKQS